MLSFLPLWLSWWIICLQCRRPGFDPGLGRSPGEGKGYPLQFSGLENSVYSPWGHKDSDMTDWLSLTHSLSLLYGSTLTYTHDYWKIVASTRWTFVGKVISLLFNTLSSFVLHFFQGTNVFKFCVSSHNTYWFWSPRK